MPQGEGRGRRGRPRGRLLAGLWPACLCSDAVGLRDDDDDDTPYTAATQDNKMAADVMTSSPDVDVGGGELCTVQLSGGSPFGFRLTDDGKGALVVGKVSALRAAAVFPLVRPPGTVVPGGLMFYC